MSNLNFERRKEKFNFVCLLTLYICYDHLNLLNQTLACVYFWYHDKLKSLVIGWQNINGHAVLSFCEQNVSFDPQVAYSVQLVKVECREPANK